MSKKYFVKGLGNTQKTKSNFGRVATQAMLAIKAFNDFQGKDWIGMDKQQKGYDYITNYKIGGTIYEVETSFAGTETLNNKIIRLMLSEKNLSKEADNSNKARYNINIHSVLSDEEKEEFDNE